VVTVTTEVGDVVAQLMRIGELAERTGLSLRTIRHYDDEGLLTPSARSAGGFRLYSETDHDRLMVIRRMKPLGFSIEQMRELLGVVDALGRPTQAPDRAALRVQLDGFVAAAVERRERLHAQLAMADDLIDTLRRLD
jgi:MerR family copper efflux transcriptional regulator